MRASLWPMVILIGAWVSVLACNASGQDESGSLVAIETGELPILLSAPHGGRQAIPGVPVRTGVGVRQFRTQSDVRTLDLTVQLADAIEEQLGERPYLVAAKFHRKYLDANRRAQDAYESPAAKATYETYHQAMTQARREIMERWGRGIVIDIHGQGAEPQAIFRGTQNGQTVKHLEHRFGSDAWKGDSSLFGRFEALGIPVIPATDSDDSEDSRYDGGFIVWTYGSRSGGTVDAIQLELGRDLRERANLSETAKTLAKAITGFAADYLPQMERNSDVRTEEELIPADP